jgi:hypothetical protein
LCIRKFGPAQTKKLQLIRKNHKLKASQRAWPSGPNLSRPKMSPRTACCSPHGLINLEHSSLSDGRQRFPEEQNREPSTVENLIPICSHLTKPREREPRASMARGEWRPAPGTFAPPWVFSLDPTCGGATRGSVEGTNCGTPSRSRWSRGSRRP